MGEKVLDPIAALASSVEETNALLRQILDAVSTRPRLLFNQAETAERLGVSEKTIGQHRRAGLMTESSLFPGRVLFSDPYLARLIELHDGKVPNLRRAS